jgi:P4 family phage/plasmid primase-like protien
VKPTPVRLFDAGWQPLVCVIPPNAPLSPQSRVSPSQRGKVPGRRNQNGTWGGYDWLNHRIRAEDVAVWANDGANIGLQTAYYPAVDIDTLDPWLAAEIQAIALEVLGKAPCRVGRAPKRLLLYRTADAFARMAIIIQYKNEKHLVEVLGAGRQCVVYGTHPSGSAYTWDTDLTLMQPERDLSWITAAQVGRFFDVVQERLFALDIPVERVGDGVVRERVLTDQNDLRAPSLEALTAAVTATPNADELFPDRDDYIKMGYAIKAAAGLEHEEDGEALFLDWASRWDGGTNEPERVRADWRRMHPPYAIGWDWIAELAGAHGFARGTYDFDAVAEARADVARVDEEPPDYSDQWLAERVLAESGHLLRYVHATGCWFVWDGGRWRADAVLLADHLIGAALRREAVLMLRRGATAQQQRQSMQTAKEFCSAARLAAVRTLLRADPRIAAPPEAFDNDPWLLNTPAGIVDLRTGAIRDADPNLMCSRQTVAAPDLDATAPLWMRFLRETTGGDTQLQEYLQRLAGYALTGTVTEQMVAFVWGPGGNGKSVFVNTLQHVMQDYAERAPMDTFTASASDRHPTDLAGLVGARLVVASETQAGRRWDEQRLKAMTGGDPVRARFMRQDFFTFMPQFTLLFLGNHKPEISHVDDALRRRIHMVPFTTKPDVVNTQLTEQLRAEAPAILAWMVRGCLAWQTLGTLAPPSSVLAATREYFDDEDAVGLFLAERCDRGEGSTPLAELYHAWLGWCHTRGEEPGSMKRLSQLLISHQLVRGHDPVTRRSTIHGVQLRPDTFDPTREV